MAQQRKRYQSDIAGVVDYPADCSSAWRSDLVGTEIGGGVTPHYAEITRELKGDREIRKIVEDAFSEKGAKDASTSLHLVYPLIPFVLSLRVLSGSVVNYFAPAEFLFHECIFLDP
jgi:hypothetical protein